jgi:DNA primase
VKYPTTIIEQIKLRVPLLDEVRKVVPKVQKKGKYWWACCPFHGEKSPSFHVREDQGSYYCFGCGAGGDVLKFVQETQGGTFSEVVERLAQQAGIKLPERETPNPERQALWEQGKYALERAKVFYQRNLGSTAKEYLQKRQLSEATVAEFGLGYSPESYTATRDALLTEGFKPEVLREVGLALASEQGKGDYDRFRGRLMFPIENLKGEVVGFGGRVLGKGEPKYLNSPETPWFNKGGQLYNLHRAKPHLKAGIPVLVEGYMDVIALWQAGFKTAVAPLGTAVGTDQLALLWQQHPSPIVCLDGDNAGRTAATRAALRALPVLEPGKSLQFAFLPDGEDPDSLVQKDGLGAFRTLLATPKSLEQVLWEHLTGGLELTTADGRASASAKLTEILAEIKHPVVKQAYRASLNEKIYQAGRGAGAKKPPKPGVLTPTVAQAPIETRGNPADDLTAAYLVALVCRWPQILPQVDESLATLPLPPGPLAELVQSLLRAYVAGHTLDAAFAAGLREGPFAHDLEKLLRDSGVATLPETTEAAAAFTATFINWQAQATKLKAQKQLLKTTNFLDPEAWAAFSRGRDGSAT